ncbi:hypothetical protein K1719_001799 [Acacia pycnantha]|nr:hypothetical protein K1719_001799 [Acacia pycnantha]
MAAAATVKKLATKPNIPFIPNDILDNIFKRLPMRPLIRFQCVCKDWKDLIKDLIQTSIEDRLHEQDCDMGVGEVQNLPSIHPLFNFEVVDFSKGLVCLNMIENGIKADLLLIWNPAARDIRVVRLRTLFHFELCDRLGFGFSPLDNDYKIVRIIGRSIYIHAVEVYSLNYKSWKEVHVGDDIKGTATFGGNVTINGVMFWDAMRHSEYNLILSFDLAKEVCRLIQKPYHRLYSPRRLIEYKNKLAMMVAALAGRNVPNLIHLWVMEKDTFKWTKIYTSSPCPCDSLCPVTIWRNEIVLKLIDLPKNDGQPMILYLLNRATNKFKRLVLPFDLIELDGPLSELKNMLGRGWEAHVSWCDRRARVRSLTSGFEQFTVSSDYTLEGSSGCYVWFNLFLIEVIHTCRFNPEIEKLVNWAEFQITDGANQ